MDIGTASSAGPKPESDQGKKVNWWNLGRNNFPPFEDYTRGTIRISSKIWSKKEVRMLLLLG
jgi:hypothetical protein